MELCSCVRGARRIILLQPNNIFTLRFFSSLSNAIIFFLKGGFKYINDISSTRILLIASKMNSSAFCDRHPDANCTAKFRPPYAYGFAVASRPPRWGVAATDNNERPSTVSRRNLHILNEGKCIFITGPV